MSPIEERTIALAGVVQACMIVQALARTGTADQSAMDASLKSILVLDAVNVSAVYGGIAGIESGLRALADGIMSSADGDSVEVLRYVMSLLHLQNQLYKDSEKFNEFAQGVERLSGISADDQLQACSDLYKQFISQISPQIIVQGEQNYLQREDIPPQVRAMLLAGIRSAVLWQQKGGGRFKLLWERTRMQNAARSLLAQQTMH